MKLAKNANIRNIRDVYVRKHSPEYARALADFYWRVLLSVALVALLISLGVGILKLTSVLKEGGNSLVQSADKIQPAPKLNKMQLQNTLTAFSEREARFNSLKAGAQRIPDPSR